MKFLIVEPSPLSILIPLGPKYSPQDPVLKYEFNHNTTNKFKFKELSIKNKDVKNCPKTFAKHCLGFA